jgi:hypothetical protein
MRHAADLQTLLSKWDLTPDIVVPTVLVFAIYANGLVSTSFKSHELYSTHDVARRLFPMSAMDDERLGGFIMWAPSSMMMLLAVLVVIHARAGYEEKLDDRRVAGALDGFDVAASPGAAPLALSPSKNHAPALGPGAFAAGVLAASLALGLLAAHGQMAAPGGHLASSHLDLLYRPTVSVRH